MSMRFMSENNRDALQELINMAHGDAAIVREAIDEAPVDKDGQVDVQTLVEYIIENRSDEPRQNGRAKYNPQLTLEQKGIVRSLFQKGHHTIQSILSSLHSGYTR